MRSSSLFASEPRTYTSGCVPGLALGSFKLAMTRSMASRAVGRSAGFVDLQTMMSSAMDAGHCSGAFGIGYCERSGSWPVTISSRMTPKLHMSASGSCRRRPSAHDCDRDPSCIALQADEDFDGCVRRECGEVKTEAQHVVVRSAMQGRNAVRSAAAAGECSEAP